MRIVKEINHTQFKITVFQWNSKYLIKFDQDGMEQTYKIDEWDVSNEGELESIINDTLTDGVMKIFRDMNALLQNAL